MQGIDTKRLPRHVAVIMDGNGRWAKKNALNRLTGHKKGADAVRHVVRTAGELGIQYLTLFAFSVENWLRPEEEINALMRLLETYLKSEIDELIERGVRLEVIGNRAALPKEVQGLLQESVQKTSRNKGMVLTLALSYGGRDEIVEMVGRIVAECASGRLRPEDISRETVAKYMYTSSMPDPDLLIRTSGEYRISNFLLWQLAFTELYFTDVLWPDFSRESFVEALRDYQRRERRFGLTSDQLTRT
ncbi:MAG: isoprenyl transferase [Syntrophales bacterium]|jgi:undecaprenyl diphosphate synthase|nr:isoprenyl transferase [Syntrophales bacterium]MCK9528213.1 isoprenyl transferase [Syntrophales bacterium]MDX9921361.1 isoprenyl transferase [Syntrophales bacterium]